jgi:hypothetical protein
VNVPSCVFAVASCAVKTIRPAAGSLIVKRATPVAVVSLLLGRLVPLKPRVVDNVTTWSATMRCWAFRSVTETEERHHPDGHATSFGALAVVLDADRELAMTGTKWMSAV